MIAPKIICSLCGITREKQKRLPTGWQEKTVIIWTPIPGRKRGEIFMQGSLYRCNEHNWLDSNVE